MKNFGILYTVGSLLQIVALIAPIIGLIVAAVVALNGATLLGLAAFAAGAIIGLCLYSFGGLVCLMVAHFRAIEDLADLIERQGMAAYGYQQPPPRQKS